MVLIYININIILVLINILSEYIKDRLTIISIINNKWIYNSHLMFYIIPFSYWMFSIKNIIKNTKQTAFALSIITESGKK